jgi:ketosteroid isomerase-like protein
MISESANKQAVAEYMAAYRLLDKARILACLTDDVEWVIPGHVHRMGKPDFSLEMDNPEAAGPPEITVGRMLEEGDVVVAEGSVRQPLRNGKYAELVFCDVFEMRDSRISKLISYLAPSG